MLEIGYADMLASELSCIQKLFLQKMLHCKEFQDSIQ